MYICVFKQNKDQADENKDMFILVQEIKERINECIPVFLRWQGKI